MICYSVVVLSLVSSDDECSYSSMAVLWNWSTGSSQQLSLVSCFVWCVYSRQHVNAEDERKKSIVLSLTVSVSVHWQCPVTVSTDSGHCHWTLWVSTVSVHWQCPVWMFTVSVHWQCPVWMFTVSGHWQCPVWMFTVSGHCQWPLTVSTDSGHCQWSPGLKVKGLGGLSPSPSS